jgi:3-methyl-2-oxobutanoate hydroxymethyltransferase
MDEKITLATLKDYKRQKQPVTMLTCYDYSMAVLLEQAGVDAILVGDTLAQMVLGHSSTLPATMPIMLELTAAVRRGAPHVYLIGDMPFLSYQVSIEQAITNAGRFMAEAQCDAVKLEVDRRYVDTVAALAKAGIPVMAHLGFRPQSAGQLDRIVETRQADPARQLIADVEQMIQAGASSILLECVTAETAQQISQNTCAPVIGIGSGPFCDGQVMVLHDVLGLPGARPSRFSKTYGRLDQQIVSAARDYLNDVRQGQFPDEAHSYHMKPQDQAQLQRSLIQPRSA